MPVFAEENERSVADCAAAVNVTVPEVHNDVEPTELMTKEEGIALTVMMPDATLLQPPPVSVTVKLYVPGPEGVPLIVTAFPAQLPDTPAGKPLKEAPVAIFVE